MWIPPTIHKQPTFCSSRAQAVEQHRLGAETSRVVLRETWVGVASPEREKKVVWRWGQWGEANETVVKIDGGDIERATRSEGERISSIPHQLVERIIRLSLTRSVPSPWMENLLCSVGKRNIYGNIKALMYTKAVNCEWLWSSDVNYCVYFHRKTSQQTKVLGVKVPPLGNPCLDAGATMTWQPLQGRFSCADFMLRHFVNSFMHHHG